MEEHGLTPRHGALLPQLLASERPLTVGELARRMRVSLPTASELVGALYRAGVVERRPDPGNRRRVLVSLAPAFHPAVERLVTARAAPLLRALDALSPRDRAGFRAGLEAWAREVQDQGAVT
ncbi:MarR family transcriptional regulator [Streptomyces sp. DSM 44917]|uniref:MarR family transcriptional regulator n=1 Tax=Streptomyces boetiae TaxID=3075541 RepID=A0ABU2LD99_9ACTN|nr:MarR family transcriptional regulator [Streptomyces sp. DSM 44917]MDT0309559.1 MarR family transcriptional regulator [Streptomyces sp. DSM 44917]